jgi:hypothetical protein
MEIDMRDDEHVGSRTVVQERRGVVVKSGWVVKVGGEGGPRRGGDRSKRVLDRGERPLRDYYYSLY